MKTITFYSYKGGVGRSLALANIATRLAEFDKKVCLVDFDLEAPGLHYKFSSHNLSKRIKKGVVEYLYDYTTTGYIPETLKDYYCNFIDNNSKKRIFLMPAGNTESPDYWKKLLSIDWNDLMYSDPAGISLFLNLKEQIKTEIKPDFLLIDSRTGISEMSGITISLLADEIVIVAANNRENLDGVRKIIRSISDPKNALINSTPKITFVLSRVPFTDKAEDKTKELNLILKLKREFSGLLQEINVIHSDRELEEDEQLKIGYVKDESVAQVSRDYLNLFEKLTFNDLSQEEIFRFKNIKESEKLFQRSLTEDNFVKKLDYINKAIELNPSNIDFSLFRAEIYYFLNEYEQAIQESSRILKDVIFSSRAIQVKGNSFIRLRKYKEAKDFFSEVIEMVDDYDYAILGLAHTLTILKEFEAAIKLYNSLIANEPENPRAYNGRANVYRLMNDFDQALLDVYKALELDPNYGTAFATLAEINAHKNNLNEFYLNFENAIRLNKESIEYSLKEEDVYKPFFKDDRFLKIIDKYNLSVE